MELILGSTSPYRRTLLERLGVPFACVAPEVDETQVAASVTDPELLAATLADAKAAAVAHRFPGAVVIGADQVASIDGRILGKPGDAARAAEQLRLLSGRAHMLLTAVSVRRGGVCRQHVDRSTLRMRPLDDAEIDRYLAVDQPFDCAGSYKIEARGIALFDSIESADHTAIVGLPLLALAALLRQFDVELP